MNSKDITDILIVTVVLGVGYFVVKEVSNVAATGTALASNVKQGVSAIVNAPYTAGQYIGNAVGSAYQYGSDALDNLNESLSDNLADAMTSF
jgi:hypothetical protein